MAVDHRANDERSNLTSSNKFELLLYRLGSVPGSDAHELYGINVFKVREISTMPPVTPIAGSSPFVMGAVDIRGQIIPVIDLPRLKRLMGQWPKDEHAAEQRREEYELALARGVHVGRFVRWVEGRNE